MVAVVGLKALILRTHLWWHKGHAYDPAGLRLLYLPCQVYGNVHWLALRRGHEMVSPPEGAAHVCHFRYRWRHTFERRQRKGYLAATSEANATQASHSLGGFSARHRKHKSWVVAQWRSSLFHMWSPSCRGMHGTRPHARPPARTHARTHARTRTSRHVHAHGRMHASAGRCTQHLVLLRHVERLRLGLYHRYASREAEARLPAASHLGPMVRALRAAATAVRHVLVVGDPVRPTAGTVAGSRQAGGVVMASRTQGREGQGLPWACIDCAAMQPARANEDVRSHAPPPPPLASSQRLVYAQDAREEEELMAAEAAAQAAGVGMECLQLALDSLSCGLTLRQWLEHVAGKRVQVARHYHKNRLLVGYAQWVARCWRQPRREVALLPASAHLQPSALAARSGAVRRLLNSSLLGGSSPVGLVVLARGCGGVEVPHETCGC